MILYTYFEINYEQGKVLLQQFQEDEKGEPHYTAETDPFLACVGSSLLHITGCFGLPVY